MIFLNLMQIVLKQFKGELKLKYLNCGYIKKVFIIRPTSDN